MKMKKNKNKYNSEICTNDMSFQDCELAILRKAVDDSESLKKQQLVKSDEIDRIIKILEDFLVKKKLICYGGTAINNILPLQDQFYNKDLEIPDYDCFSDKAMENAKQLADLYYKKGFTEVEAKAGMHYGTYKVFVNFIPVADITLLTPEIFNNMKKEAITVGGILYAPPNYLRMSMYLELSRPDGDISRWEKVLKRITLLNKHYPLMGKDCKNVDFQRGMESNIKDEDKLYEVTKNALIDEGVVMFGGLANTLYSRYMPKKLAHKLSKSPDFDVLAEDAELTASMIKEKIEQAGFKKVDVFYHEKIGEIISDHYEIRVGLETVCFIYTPLACHSYNTITIDNKVINVATIDTMLSFYLAFLYSDRKYYDKNRILCMSQYLFIVQQRNRLAQKGLLRRFSLNCYGKQETMELMRAEKANKFIELKSKRNAKEYEEWFLRYVPRNNPNIKKSKLREKSKTKKIVPKTPELEITPTKSKKKPKKNKRKKTRRKRTRRNQGFFGLF